MGTTIFGEVDIRHCALVATLVQKKLLDVQVAPMIRQKCAGRVDLQPMGLAQIHEFVPPRLCAGEPVHILLRGHDSDLGVQVCRL